MWLAGEDFNIEGKEIGSQTMQDTLSTLEAIALYGHDSPTREVHLRIAQHQEKIYLECLKISEVTEIYHHPQPLYYYRVHPATISVRQKVQQTERAAHAVRNALVRGLSDRYRLDVIEGDRFKIVSWV